MCDNKVWASPKMFEKFWQKNKLLILKIPYSLHGTAKLRKEKMLLPMPIAMWVYLKLTFTETVSPGELYKATIYLFQKLDL